MKPALKILLVNHSDSRGGASVVTRRLMDALCAAGADARMLVTHKATASLRVSEAASARRARLPFLAEHADIFMRNGFRRDTLFRISTARYGLPLSRHPWVREADVVVLNWVNQGVLSLREIGRLAELKPVIWTMHDAWNMTGVCHYTAGCRRWLTDECRGCPLVGRGDLAHKVYAAKRRLYAGRRIRFVAVSNGLAELCRQSPLMEGCDIEIIPNAFPVDSFPTRPSLTRAELGLPEGTRLIVAGAARLDDPVKNLPLAVEALNGVSTADTAAVFFGNIRNASLLSVLRMPYVWLGPIDASRQLPSVMAHADAVISTSVWETLPGTLVEGVSAGAVAVATSNGGQRDIIVNDSIGRLVDGDDPGRFAAAIDSVLALPQNAAARSSRHRAMASLFSAEAVARRYLALMP